MKPIRVTLLVAVSLSLALGAVGQGFRNLNFETTTITPVVFPGGTRYTATIPNWTWTPVGNFVNGDPNSVGYDDLALDSPAVDLEGTDFPFAAAIQGNYSVLLQGGSSLLPSTSFSAIGQTGQIPLTAKSIIYWGGGLQVSFNGMPLSCQDIGDSQNYTIWGADISTYAGQTGQLLFKAPWQTEALLDNIQFSSSQIPEPSALSCFTMGVLLLLIQKRIRTKS